MPQMLEPGQLLRLPNHEREQYLREIIRQTVKLNPNGVRVSVLTKFLPIDSRTISKYLTIMEYTNEVYSEKDGSNVNYFPNSRLMHPISEQAFDLGHVEFQVYHLRNKNLGGDSIFIQERKKDEYKDDIGSGIIIPIDKFKQFTQYLGKIAEEL